MWRLLFYLYSINSVSSVKAFRNVTMDLGNDAIDLRNDTMDFRNDTEYTKGGNINETSLIRFEDHVNELVDDTIDIKDKMYHRNDTNGLRNYTNGLKNYTTGLRNKTNGLINYTTGLRNDTNGLRNDTNGLRNDTNGLRNYSILKNDTVYPEGPKTALIRFEDVFMELQALERATTAVTNVPYLLNSVASIKRVKRQNKKHRQTTTPRIETADMKRLRLKKKIFDLMQQSLYAAQEHLWPVEKSLAKYEHLSPYRMAFIFGQLQLLSHEAQSIVQQIERQHINKQTSMSPTRRLQIYWILVRDNIDVGYLIDYILERVPKDQVAALRKKVLRKEEEDMKKMMAMAKARGTDFGRPRPSY